MVFKIIELASLLCVEMKNMKGRRSRSDVDEALPLISRHVLGMKFSTRYTYNDMVGAGRCKKIRDQSPSHCLIGRYIISRFSFSPSLRNPEQMLKSALLFKSETPGHVDILRPRSAFCF